MEQNTNSDVTQGHVDAACERNVPEIDLDAVRKITKGTPMNESPERSNK
jgi:hypothetical protein